MTSGERGDEEELIKDLTKQLTLARQRGLNDLDLKTSDERQKPVAAADLERLARTYARNQQSARIKLIERLLRDALAAWDRAGYTREAALVRRLFFTNGGSPRPAHPGTLLADARRASGLDEDAFDELRRFTFGQFARHLITFVSTQQGVSPVTNSGPGAPAEQAAANPLSADVGRPIFRFDALGGGSQVIRVYPGVGDSPADRTPNERYFSGDVVLAICQTRGRTVHSHPEVGERLRESDIWIRIASSSGSTQFATLTYGDMTRGDLDALPWC